MNKTEKLLAARKKLKEFQQHKLNNHQNSETKEKSKGSQENNGPSESTTPPEPKDKELQKLIQSSPSDSRTSLEIIASPESTELPCISSENSRNDSPSQLIEVSSIIDQHLPPEPSNATENPQENSQNLFEAFNNSHQKSDDIFTHLKPMQNGNSQSTSDSQNGSSNQSPSLQKQHLLQMASDVANALVETGDANETIPMNSDLEYRNQFLTTCLDEQKRLVNQLHIQVSQYSSRVSELEALLSTRDAEFEAKLLRETNPLKEQLKIHAQTTGILVAEKSELSSAIAQYQSIAQKKTEEVEELCSKLKASHSKVSEVERELLHLRNATEEMKRNFHQLQSDNSHLEKKYSELKRDKEEQQLESAELRQELNLKSTELSSLHRELSEKKNLLSLAELKIQQLTNAPNEMQALEGQHQAQTVLEQQISQLRETLKSVNAEKEETSKHYENYVKQLDSRYEKIVQELEAAKSRIGEFEEREASFIQRLSIMEQQYQREKQRVESLLPLQVHEERVHHLTKSMDSLVIEQETLQATIRERDAEIEGMREELHQLRELRDQSVETLKLVSALESEQLGASRAVSQNQQLKAQLNEMHDAFVTLSNSKLDLTEKLQGERTIGKKLNAELNKVEAERDQLREELKQKDSVIEELERDKLQTAQIADQMQHYQVQSNQTRTLQQELQSAFNEMELLKRENLGLNEKLKVLESSKRDADHSFNEENKGNGEINSEVLGESLEKVDCEVQTNGNEDEVLSEPLKKLEGRFKETMEKVAELTDEKQKLEHLVLQLQGETETIGEYITLYQKQRAILQKKAQERELTFRQLVEQRNQQQVQLHQLKVLVAELLKSQTSSSSPLNQEIPPAVNSRTNATEVAEPPSEINQPSAPTIDPKNETTAKILDLLTEIKDCKDTCSLEPNFHPCLWCSGKLITV